LARGERGKITLFGRHSRGETEQAMANKGRTSFAKRQKEIARQERAREKAAKRVERKEAKDKESPRGAADVDPDIAGIVPGPQPLPYDLFEAENEEKESS
jgi:hypothetical protein